MAPGLDEDADADATGLAESRPYLPKAPGLAEDADATGVEWDECVGYITRGLGRGLAFATSHRTPGVGYVGQYPGMVIAKGNSLILGGRRTTLALQYGHVILLCLVNHMSWQPLHIECEHFNLTSVGSRHTQHVVSRSRGGRGGLTSWR